MRLPCVLRFEPIRAALELTRLPPSRVTTPFSSARPLSGRTRPRSSTQNLVCVTSIIHFGVKTAGSRSHKACFESKAVSGQVVSFRVRTAPGYGSTERSPKCGRSRTAFADYEESTSLAVPSCPSIHPIVACAPTPAVFVLEPPTYQPPKALPDREITLAAPAPTWRLPPPPLTLK
jgi:hypothetical protein